MRPGIAVGKALRHTVAESFQVVAVGPALHAELAVFASVPHQLDVDAAARRFVAFDPARQQRATDERLALPTPAGRAERRVRNDLAKVGPMPKRRAFPRALYGPASVRGATRALVRLGLVADVLGVGGQRFVALRVRFNDRCPFRWADEPPARRQLRLRSCESRAADREQHAHVILAHELRGRPSRIDLHLHAQPAPSAIRQIKSRCEVDGATPARHSLLACAFLDAHDRRSFVAEQRLGEPRARLAVEEVFQHTCMNDLMLVADRLYPIHVRERTRRCEERSKSVVTAGVQSGATTVTVPAPAYYAEYPFSGSGLLIRANALGLRRQWTLGDKEITLALPSLEESYTGFPPERLGVRVGRVVASKHDEPILISVERFSTTFGVKPDSELGADDDWKAAADLLSDLYVVAVDVAQDFMNAVRVQGGQFWLPAQHERVRRDGLISLYRADTHERLPFSWNPPRSITVFGEESAADHDELVELLEMVAERKEPRLAATLLADARGVLIPPAVHEAIDRLDTPHAVLLAAIAAEVRIKETLRESATGELRLLLDIVLDSPRDVSVAAGQLLDKPLKVITGTSLREADKPLFKLVTEKLFPLRNRVAHYGHRPTAEEASDAVATATDLFAWLDGLQGD